LGLVDGSEVAGPFFRTFSPNSEEELPYLDKIEQKFCTVPAITLASTL